MVVLFTLFVKEMHEFIESKRYEVLLAFSGMHN